MAKSAEEKKANAWKPRKTAWVVAIIALGVWGQKHEPEFRARAKAHYHPYDQTYPAQTRTGSGSGPVESFVAEKKVIAITHELSEKIDFPGNRHVDWDCLNNEGVADSSIDYDLLVNGVAWFHHRHGANLKIPRDVSDMRVKLADDSSLESARFQILLSRK